MRIRWINLQDELRKILKQEVQIHASTEAPRGLNAYVLSDGGRTDILLNLLYLKSKDEILEGLAHEAAHALAEDKIHSEKWAQAKEKVKKKLEKVV